MTGAEFKAWREGVGMTQERAGVLAGMSRKTVVRAEASDRIPAKLAAVMGAMPVIQPDKPAAPANTPQAALRAVKAKAAAPTVTKALAAAMLRNPPYAKTAAEARAMRQLRAQQRGLPVSKIRLLPLRPDWVRLDGGREVNAAIPRPVAEPAPAWAGPRGVLTESGTVYDFEAAHKMKPPHDHGAAQVTAGEW